MRLCTHTLVFGVHVHGWCTMGWGAFDPIREPGIRLVQGPAGREFFFCKRGLPSRDISANQSSLNISKQSVWACWLNVLNGCRVVRTWSVFDQRSNNVQCCQIIFKHKTVQFILQFILVYNI